MGNKNSEAAVWMSHVEKKEESDRGLENEEGGLSLITLVGWTEVLSNKKQKKTKKKTITKKQ